MILFPIERAFRNVTVSAPLSGVGTPSDPVVIDTTGANPGDALTFDGVSLGFSAPPGLSLDDITSNASTVVYPAAVIIRQHLDAGGAGGDVNLPLSAGLTVGTRCQVRNVSAGALTVKTLDGATINGAPTYPMLYHDQQFDFTWTGTEWGVG